MESVLYQTKYYQQESAKIVSMPTVFVDGGVWKSYIIKMSTISVFHATQLKNIHWIFNFHRFFANSVLNNFNLTKMSYQNFMNIER